MTPFLFTQLYGLNPPLFSIHHSTQAILQSERSIHHFFRCILHFPHSIRFSRSIRHSTRAILQSKLSIRYFFHSLLHFPHSIRSSRSIHSLFSKIKKRMHSDCAFSLIVLEK